MTLGSRSLRQETFDTTDETRIIPVPEGGAKGKIAVFGRLTGSGGAASIRVSGAFDASDEAAGSATPLQYIQTLDFGDIGFETFPDISDLNGASASIAPEFLTQDLSKPDGNATTQNIRTEGANTTIQEPLVPALTGFQNTAAYVEQRLPGEGPLLGPNTAAYVEQRLPGEPSQEVGQPPPFDDEIFKSTVITPSTTVTQETGTPPPFDDETFSSTVITPASLPPAEEQDDGAWSGSFAARSLLLPQAAATDGYTLTHNPNNFTLTYNTHVSSVVLYSTDMRSDIEAALVGLADFVTGDVTVTKTSTSVYVITFSPAITPVGDITITNQLNFTATGTTDSTTGGGGTFGSEDLTDNPTLANAIAEVVSSNDAIFPYLVLAYNGDGDPNLAAEIYVTSF